jgi:UDP-N-acetylmuramate dehydrogenase
VTRAGGTIAELTQREVNLQPFNTLAVPSQAEAFAELEQPTDFPTLLDYSRAEGLPLLPLGEGSNVVLAEQLEALVLRQACRGVDLLAESVSSVRLRVAAGENWHSLVGWCLQQSYFGLENLALIPGTVGAAPVQNIGAYGVEVASYIVAVEAVDLLSGEALRLSNQECQFSYRDSIFKAELADQLLIQAVELELPKQANVNTDYPALAAHLQAKQLAAATPQQVFEAVVAIRRSKLPDPAEIPNVGSFFKNPSIGAEQVPALLEQWPELPVYPQADQHSRIAAGWMIDACGFRERQADAVHVHPQHALVITNPQRRGGSEVLALAAEIVAAVEQRFAVTLEQEPRSYGWV